MFQLENFKELCIITLKDDAKLKRNLNRGLKNDIKNLVDLHASGLKSGNFHFDGLLLSIAYEELDEEGHKSHVSRHSRVMQSLKKN